MCTLAAHRQRSAMPKTAIATNVHQPLNVHLDTLAQVTFDFTLGLKNSPDATKLILT
jgi:hypothetical protein